MTQSSSEHNVAVNKGTGDAGTIEIEVLLLGSQKTRTIRRKKGRRREKAKKKIIERRQIYKILNDGEIICGFVGQDGVVYSDLEA
jgi:hypothetical protein